MRPRVEGYYINPKAVYEDQKFVAVKVPVGFVLKLDRKMACLSIHKLVRSTPDGCSCKLCEGQLVLHLVCGTRRHGVHLWSLSWILFKPRFDTTLAHLFCENETESKIFLAVKVWHHEFPVHDIGLTSIVDRRNVFSHDVAQNLTYGEIACIAHKSNGSPSLEQSRLELCKYIFQCLKARMAVIGKDDNGVFFSRWWDEEIFAMTSILALSTSIPFLEILWPADYFPSTIHLFSKMTGNLVVASKNAYSRWGGSSLSSPREVVLLSGIIVEWFICLWTIRIISLGPKERVSFFEKQEIISLNGVRVGEEVATIGSYTGVEFPLTIISVKPRTIESTSLTSLSMTSILFADMWSVIGPSIRSLIPNLGRCAVLCEQEGALGTFVTSGIGFTTIVPSLNSRGGSFSAIFGLAPSIGESEKAYKLIRSNWNIGDPHCGGDLVESNGYEHEGLLFVYDRMNLFVADKIDLPCSVRNCCLKFKDKDCVLVPIGWVLGAIDQLINNKKIPEETPEVIKDFLTVLQRNLQAAVISVQTDKGIEFLNKTLYAFFKEEGIEHQTSTPRTPEQNGVVERRNHTLVEAARTMLLAFKLPLFDEIKEMSETSIDNNNSGLAMHEELHQFNRLQIVDVPVPETLHEQTMMNSLSSLKLTDGKLMIKLFRTILLGLLRDIYAAVDSVNLIWKSGYVIVGRNQVVQDAVQNQGVRILGMEMLDLVEIVEVNENAFLMANCSKHRTSEEQYTEILEPTPEPHQVQQNDNVISDISCVEQEGGTVDQHTATVEETRAYFESLLIICALEVEKELTTLLRPQKAKTRSIQRYDRVPSASKSSCNKNKEVEVEEPQGSLSAFKNKKHHSS
ncbi:retrovirus-related pol polyprotein from transposon TNT 1-94 [Tanacetum coccineum]